MDGPLNVIVTNSPVSPQSHDEYTRVSRIDVVKSRQAVLSRSFASDNGAPSIHHVSSSLSRPADLITGLEHAKKSTLYNEFPSINTDISTMGPMSNKRPNRKQRVDSERASFPLLETSTIKELESDHNLRQQLSAEFDSNEEQEEYYYATHSPVLSNKNRNDIELDDSKVRDIIMTIPTVRSRKNGQHSSTLNAAIKDIAPEPKSIVTEVNDIYSLQVLNPAEAEGIGGRNSGNQYWLPRKVARVTIEETQKYTFAIVLRHTDQVYRILRKRFPSKSAASIRKDLPYQVSELQQKILRRLIQAGLGVILLDNDRYDADEHDDEPAAADKLLVKNICILIDPKKDPDLLLHEFKREMNEIALQQGDGIGRLGEESLDTLRTMSFSPALELQLTHNIIENAFKDYDKEEWVMDVNKELRIHDVIQECFPLHDRHFNNKFFSEYRKRTLDINIRRTATGNVGRWAVEELRLHFGERVAFLFAFMHIYTKHLITITLIGALFYLSNRFFSGYVWRHYVQGLVFLGVMIACVWGPTFLLCWERETHLLVEQWNLSTEKATVYEKNDTNPDFQYVWVKNSLTKEMEKVPRSRNRLMIQAIMLCYVFLSAFIQCVFLVPFIHWYVYAKNAPVCNVTCNVDERWWFCRRMLTCFNDDSSKIGTDRWLYILGQGIVLGLLIDIVFFEIFNWISEKFVRWENLPKKSEYEDRLIHRRFIFVWSNWFFWFLFLSFVYLPFGDIFTDWVSESTTFKVIAPEWNPTLLSLDTLFVTPLVVTQMLNMILETAVPYLVRKLRGTPVACHRRSPFAWCGRMLFKVKDADDEGEDGIREEQYWFTWCTKRLINRMRNKPLIRVNHSSIHSNHFMTAKRLAHLVKLRTELEVDVMPFSDDSNGYCAYEVVADSTLPVFDPMLDYLDASIQFSYVVMFSIVWPLLPLPAFINNLLEVRGDAFRLLFANRRPMPRRDTSIGEWSTVLNYANVIAIMAVMGFVCVYHLGYFYSTCDFTFAEGPMVPFSSIVNDVATENSTIYNAINDITCVKGKLQTDSWLLYQAFIFIVLEHIGLCVRHLVLQVDKTPESIRNPSFLRLKHIQDLNRKRAGPASQFAYVQKLREIFDKYDADGDGYLYEGGLISFLAEWICKHPSELLPYSHTIFRYMDKNGLGRISFDTCCLMLQHVNHDRFFSCLLGIYDPNHGELNEEIRNTEEPMEFRRVMSEVSSVVSEDRSSIIDGISRGSFSSTGGSTRVRNSSFFYNP